MNTPSRVPEVEWLIDNGFSFDRSNLPDRKVGGPLRRASKRENADYRAGVEAATRGPVGLRVVRLAEEPRLAFPVPVGWSAQRVARLVVERWATACVWCDSADVSWGLLVSCGAALCVLGTCGWCQSELQAETGFPDQPCPLHFVENDGWSRSVGYPADRWQ